MPALGPATPCPGNADEEVLENAFAKSLVRLMLSIDNDVKDVDSVPESAANWLSWPKHACLRSSVATAVRRFFKTRVAKWQRRRQQRKELRTRHRSPASHVTGTSRSDGQTTSAAFIRRLGPLGRILGGATAASNTASSAAEQASNSVSATKINGARGVFPNPTNTTCYLGSCLQGLLHTQRFSQLAQEHDGKRCPQHCGFCQVKAAEEGTRRPGSTHSLTGWGHFMARHGRVLCEQQDAAEVLACLMHDAGVEDQNPADDVKAWVKAAEVRRLEQRIERSPCNHAGDNTVTATTEESYLELIPRDDVTTCDMVDLLKQDGNAEVLTDFVPEPCHICGLGRDCVRSREVVGAEDVVIIAVQRMRWGGEGPYLNRTAVRPLPQLTINREQYRLASLIEHQGTSL